MKQTNGNREAMKYIGLGTQLLVLLGIAVWGGIELDKKTGFSFPLFVVLFPVIALFYALYSLIRSLNNNKK